MPVHHAAHDRNNRLFEHEVTEDFAANDPLVVLVIPYCRQKHIRLILQPDRIKVRELPPVAVKVFQSGLLYFFGNLAVICSGIVNLDVFGGQLPFIQQFLYGIKEWP